MPGYGAIDEAYATRLATTAPGDDGPVWMVNLMKYREIADYGDGESHGRTGRDADDAYAPHGPLAAVGAEIVYAAEVAATFLGDGTEWDRVAIVRYPTRRSFVEMQERDDFRALHVHKEAGMAKTVVIGCVPFTTQPDERSDWPGSADWDDVAHPPSDSDGVVHLLHVIAWSDAGRDTMEGYHRAAIGPAAAAGVRIAGWLEAEGTIIGDGRSWDEVRFNEFPSLAQFMEVAADPGRLEAQAAHREPAMADTYAIACRPVIDRLRASFS